MRKRVLVTAAAVVLLALPAVPAAADDLCDIDGVVIFASNSVKISRDSVVTGDVVADSASAGPVLDEGAEVAVDQRATVNGSCAGDTVDIDKFATVTGAVRHNELSNKGTIDGGEISPLALPVFTELPAFGSASPSGVDVVVGIGQTVTVGDLGVGALNRRDFGDISIGENGILVFSGGGRFDAESVSGGPGAMIQFAAAGELRVAAGFVLDSDSFVGTAVPGGSDVVIYVGGVNGGSGGLFGSPAAVDIGRESTVEANVYAPNGTIRFGQGSQASGSFLARDVNIEKNSIVTLDSAFSNAAPTAVAEEVQTDGSSPLVITLSGSDPELNDLDFSIEVPPTAGMLGAITPIVPAPVNGCSESGGACSVDSDCPGFAGGETCDQVQPPITQATVTYTPVAASCVTEPSSGETTCPEDYFTFGVTDPCGALGTAIVSINGGTDEIPGDPGSGTDVVDANDVELDAVVNEVRTISLSAAAPDGVAAITFRVETLPTGALQDSNGAAVVAGADLPGPILTYQAPGTAGADSFSYSARDSSTTAPPCGPPSCDTAAVNIFVGNLPELAPDQSMGTDLNTPVEVTLFANAGGTGDGGGQEALAGSYQVTQGENGSLSAWQMSRSASRQGIGRRGTRAGVNGPTALTIDGGWSQFGWCDMVTSPNCDLLVDLVNAVEVAESPFEFTTTEPSCLRITDTLAKGDHWRVDATTGGAIDWVEFTSEVPQSTVGTTGDASTAFGDLSYSHGAYDLVGDGSYSVELTTIAPDSFAFGTAGYIRIDTGPCVDIVWTVTSLPANGTLTNPDGSPVLIGATYVSTPTVIYTPAFNYTGPDGFNYEVTQNGTLGVNAVVDSAFVDLFTNPNDPCILVGRDPGCSPGSGGQEVVESGASSEPDFGPARGLTLSVEGAGGAVSSSAVDVSTGGRVGALFCASGAAGCNKAFPAGAAMKLYARPNGEQHEFLGWGGDCRGTEPIITIVLDQATHCTAYFGPKSD